MTVKLKLDNVIKDLSDDRKSFVKNPEVDFTRNRKFSFEDVIKIVLSMKGNTLSKELYDYFGKDPEVIGSSSAFIQQRNKLNDNVFEEIFYRFNSQFNDDKTYKGYKLCAVDGTDINVFYDESAETYVKPSNNKKDGSSGKGHNQIHLSVIYDLLNKVYVDAYMQSRSKLDERVAFVNMFKNTEYSKKTLFIMDRGYPSWNLFTYFKYKGNADFLIRYPNDLSFLTKDLPLVELDIERTVYISTHAFKKSKKIFGNIDERYFTKIFPRNRVKNQDLDFQNIISYYPEDKIIKIDNMLTQNSLSQKIACKMKKIVKILKMRKYFW